MPTLQPFLLMPLRISRLFFVTILLCVTLFMLVPKASAQRTLTQEQSAITTTNLPAVITDAWNLSLGQADRVMTRLRNTGETGSLLFTHPTVVRVVSSMLLTFIFIINLCLAIPALPVTVWLLILLLVGLRKKRMPWGRAMNSVTNQPIPLTTVTLHDQKNYGRVVARVLTDKNGRFGFYANPGQYTLWAQKPGYTFPSKKLLNTYRGGPFEIHQQGMIIIDLFCDPNFTFSGWRAIITQFSYWLSLLHVPILTFGSLLSLFFFFRYATTINGIILALYVVFWGREFYQREFNRHTLRVFDSKNKPVPYATVRVIDRRTKENVVTRNTDPKGELYVLIPSGDYTFSITHPLTQRVTDLHIPLPEGIFTKPTKVKIN